LKNQDVNFDCLVKHDWVGWREWVALPALGVPAVKAKLDTGARTSALHVVDLETVETPDGLQVRFVLHPLRRRPQIALACQAQVIDQRVVRDSGGHQERRYVIRTPVRLGQRQWPIELTLTNRDNMLFRMLLGRTAMQGLVIDPQQSYRYGRSLRHYYHKS